MPPHRVYGTRYTHAHIRTRISEGTRHTEVIDQEDRLVGGGWRGEVLAAAMVAVVEARLPRTQGVAMEFAGCSLKSNQGVGVVLADAKGEFCYRFTITERSRAPFASSLRSSDQANYFIVRRC